MKREKKENRKWKEKRKKNENEKRKEREKNERIKKQERRENINLLIQINKQIDGRTDRHKSFIDMRYNTEQYSKSNSIE